MNKNWSIVRESYIGNNSIIVNHLKEHTDDDTEESYDSETQRIVDKKFTFLSVVKEAVKKEREDSKKKERPSLLRFLEKFEGVDIPESVTPNPNESFSHFEEVEDQEDKDLGLLKTSLNRVSGSCKGRRDCGLLHPVTRLNK